MKHTFKVFKTLVLMIGVTGISATAHAACTNPAGVEGEQIYNDTHNVMQYCDGTDWTAMRGDGDTLSSLSCADGQVAEWNGSNWICTTNAGGSTIAINDLSDGGTDATSVFLGSTAGANDDGANSNVAVGINALTANTSGDNNVAIGTNSLTSNTTAGNNTAVGYNSMRSNLTGFQNTALGRRTLELNTDGNDNIAIGMHAMNNATGSNQNISIGQFSMAGSPALGDSNIGLGFGVMSASSGNRNIGIGNNANLALVRGDYNIAIGDGSGNALTNGSNNILIGRDVDTPTATTSEYLSIGDLITGDIGTTSGDPKIGVAKYCDENLTNCFVATDVGGGGDNLGNHTATTALDLATNDINNAGTINIGNAMVLSDTNATGTGPDIQFNSGGLIAADGSLTINLDSNNDQTATAFLLRKDTNNSSGSQIFRVSESGEVTVEGKIINLTDPTNAQDAATKAYVDAEVAGVTATPAGADTQIQFNDGGVLNADSAFTFDKTEKSASIFSNYASTNNSANALRINKSGNTTGSNNYGIQVINSGGSSAFTYGISSTSSSGGTANTNAGVAGWGTATSTNNNFGVWGVAQSNNTGNNMGGSFIGRNGSNNYGVNGSVDGVGATNSYGGRFNSAVTSGAGYGVYGSATGLTSGTNYGGYFIATNATKNWPLYVAGNAGFSAGSYLNFGATSSTPGATGYGLRDNAGVLEYKNSGGSWSSFAAGGDTLSGLSCAAGEVAEWNGSNWICATNGSGGGGGDDLGNGGSTTGTLYSSNGNIGRDTGDRLTFVDNTRVEFDVGGAEVMRLTSSTLDLNGNRIIDLADPVNAQNAATKSYVDAQISSSGDNLGNHTATTALDLATNDINNAGTINIGNAMVLSDTNATNTGPDIQFNNGGLIAAGGSLTINLDSNNDQTATAFLLRKDTNNSSGSQIFRVSESGEVTVEGKIINLTDPTNAQDAATKAYVDAQVGGASNADTLDTLDSLQFIRSDANDDVSGHTEWQDAFQIRLGNAADFRMAHNGTNTFMRSYLDGSDVLIQADNATNVTQTMTFDPDAGIDINDIITFGLSGDVNIEPDILFSNRGLIASEDGFLINIDTDNDSSDEFFRIKKDVNNDGGAGTTIFEVLENGNTFAGGTVGANAFCPDGNATCDPTLNEAFTPTGIGATNIYAGSGGEIDIQDQINFNNNVILGVATPTANSHAANKSYVDAQVAGAGSSDADTLDTLDSLQFIRSDANDTVSGHTVWQDNSTVRLGTGNDFRMSFNATDTIMRSYSHGSRLLIQGEDAGGTNRNLIVADPDNTVTLYHNGAAKLATSAAGLSVTGLISNLTDPVGPQDATTKAYVDSAISGASDADTLDGIDSANFLRSNADDFTSGDLGFSAGSGRGLRFWNSDSYKIYMSNISDATWGGRLDTTSDHNMYFRMSAGTNRGFVFRNGTTNVAQIDGGGNIYTTGSLNMNNNPINAAGIVTAGELVWENGVNRITNNDGAGNVQIRFGHDFSSSDERFTHAGGAAIIRSNLDATSGTNLEFAVASNPGAGDNAALTWGDALLITANDITFGGTSLLTGTGDDLGAGGSGDLITDGTIDSSEIQDNTLTADDLAADSVTASEIAAGAVGAGELANNSVNSNKIVNNSITSGDILDGTIASGDLNATLLSNLNDADTIDGLNSTAFIRADANDNVSAHTEWQDNFEIRLGNDADFRIEHTGSNHIIRGYTHGTPLFIQGENAGGTNRNLIWADPDNEVRLYYAGAEKFNTRSDGVEVTGTAYADYLVLDSQDGTNEGGELRLTGAGSNSDFQIDNFQGNARIHTLTPGKFFDVIGGSGMRASGLVINGNISFTGTLTDTSDIRLKDNITPLTTMGSLLDKITAVETISFTMKDDKNKKIEYGVKAQQLETIFPELVETADDEIKTKSVNYLGLIAPIIEAIKELKTSTVELFDVVGKLQKENAELKQQHQDILERLEKLEKESN